MKNENSEHLTLKWGTLKAWRIESAEGKVLLERYFEIGACSSAMMQDDTPEQKEIICKLIDIVSAEKIFLDWSGEYVSKETAKKYVMEYGIKK